MYILTFGMLEANLLSLFTLREWRMFCYNCFYSSVFTNNSSIIKRMLIHVQNRLCKLCRRVRSYWSDLLGTVPRELTRVRGTLSDYPSKNEINIHDLERVINWYVWDLKFSQLWILSSQSPRIWRIRVLERGVIVVRIKLIDVSGQYIASVFRVENSRLIEDGRE
jgi:hypothetical protein